LDPNFDDECLALMKAYEQEQQQTTNDKNNVSSNVASSQSQYDEPDDDDMDAAYYRELEEKANMQTNYDEDYYEYVDDNMDEYL
jgi:hypothetical protein